MQICGCDKFNLVNFHKFVHQGNENSIEIMGTTAQEVKVEEPDEAPKARLVLQEFDNGTPSIR